MFRNFHIEISNVISLKSVTRKFFRITNYEFEKRISKLVNKSTVCKLTDYKFYVRFTRIQYVESIMEYGNLKNILKFRNSSEIRVQEF